MLTFLPHDPDSILGDVTAIRDLAETPRAQLDRQRADARRRRHLRDMQRRLQDAAKHIESLTRLLRAPLGWPAAELWLDDADDRLAALRISVTGALAVVERDMGDDA